MSARFIMLTHDQQVHEYRSIKKFLLCHVPLYFHRGHIATYDFEREHIGRGRGGHAKCHSAAESRIYTVSLPRDQGIYDL